MQLLAKAEKTTDKTSRTTLMFKLDFKGAPDDIVCEATDSTQS